MNYGTLRGIFYEQLGDSAQKYVSYGSAREYASRALRKAAEVSGALHRRTVILLEADVATYDLPSDVDHIWRVAYDGEKLMPTTTVQLRLRFDQWETHTGKPRMYLLDELNRQIRLYPMPDAGTATQADTFDGGYGVIVADDAGGTFDGEYGLIVDASDDSTFNSEHGVIVGAISGQDLEIFYRAAPEDLALTVDELLIPAWAVYFVLWEMLADAYAADTDLRDLSVSAVYRSMAAHVLARLRIRANAPLPKLWQKQLSGIDVPIIETRGRIPERVPYT